MLAAERMTIREGKKMKGHSRCTASSPPGEYALSQSKWKRKANLQLLILHPHQLLQTHQGWRNQREGWAAAVSCRALTSTSISPAPVGHLCDTIWESCPRTAGSEPSGDGSAHTQAPLTPPGQAERYNRDLQAHGSQGSAVYCTQVVVDQFLTIMLDGNLSERHRSTHLSYRHLLPRAVGGWDIGIGKTGWLQKALVDKEGQSCAWLKWDQSWTAQQSHSWGAAAAVPNLIEKLFLSSENSGEKEMRGLIAVRWRKCCFDMH